MARKKRVYEDDDGRTIADMRDVTRPSMFTPRSVNRTDADPGQPAKPDRPWEDGGLSRRERLMCVLGAMKATMLIALAYIVGLGLVIALLLALWHG